MLIHRSSHIFVTHRILKCHKLKHVRIIGNEFLTFQYIFRNYYSLTLSVTTESEELIFQVKCGIPFQNFN